MKYDKSFCFMFLSVFLALTVNKTHLKLRRKILNQVFTASHSKNSRCLQVGAVVSFARI